MDKKKFNLELEKQRIMLKIRKAEVAKEEMDVKILELQDQKYRIEDHKKLQDKAILQAKEELKTIEVKLKATQ